MSKHGKPGRQLALKQKTVNALATKSRIQAIVGQVIDELEDRRAKGKSDYVAQLANEVEKGGIAAWKSLRDLLPADDPQLGGGAQFNFGGNVFLNAAIEASKRQPSAIDNTEIIDVPFKPVPAIEDEPQHEPAEEDEPIDW
jgi:hypothetical protein